MPQNHRTRVIIDLAIAIAVLQGWWFIFFPLALIGAWNFPFYVEIIVAGVLYDLLFGLATDAGLKGYLGTMMAIVGLIILAVAKKVVRR